MIAASPIQYVVILSYKCKPDIRMWVNCGSFQAGSLCPLSPPLRFYISGTNIKEYFCLQQRSHTHQSGNSHLSVLEISSRLGKRTDYNLSDWIKWYFKFAYPSYLYVESMCHQTAFCIDIRRYTVIVIT